MMPMRALKPRMPDFARRYADRYAGMGLRDLCHALHDFYRTHEASRLQREEFMTSHFPEQVMLPRAAWEEFLRNNVD